ncbi:MAG: hypothetical protein ACWA41_02885 [Putridiphycobacter sp.]
MIKYFFTTLSYFFHPLFLPILGLYILFEIPVYSFGIIVNPEIKTFLYYMFGLLTVVAPGISILILYWNKAISSLHMPNRNERYLPMILILVYYIILYWFIRYNFPALQVIEFLMPFIFGFILTTVVGLIFNFYFKISLHAIGFFGLIGAVTAYMQDQIFYNFPFIIILILVGGVVSSGRIYLKSHQLKEVLFGMIFGFGIEYMCLKFNFFI